MLKLYMHLFYKRLQVKYWVIKKNALMIVNTSKLFNQAKNKFESSNALEVTLTII